MTPQQVDQMTLSELTVILGDDKPETWDGGDIMEIAQRWQAMTPVERIMQAGENW